VFLDCVVCYCNVVAAVAHIVLSKTVTLKSTSGVVRIRLYANNITRNNTR
jgi:hypothetical protein